jgi:hypothetical protein
MTIPGFAAGNIEPASSTWTSTECARYAPITSCGVPYPNLADCIATCSSSCNPVPGGYACCSTSQVCVSTTTCTHYDGDCTGTKLFFWQPPPTRCVTSASGLTKCAGGWNQYPWILQCANGSQSSGVGFCLW